MKSNRRLRVRARKRRILLLFLMSACLLLLLACCLKIRQIYQYDDGFLRNRKGRGENYSAEAPHKIEDDAIADKLDELSEEYPEVKEIRKHMEEYPPELLKSLCNNPEMLEFVQGYLTSDGSVTGGLTEEEIRENIPLLIQWDKRWGYASYGDSNIGLSGCAPTCLSMVITGLTKDKTATPYAVADYAMKEGYYMEGSGTAWSLMTDGAGAFGIEGRELPLDKNTVYLELEAGHPIICSVRPGDFTTEGHFIVLAEIRDGKIAVNDPNSRGRSSVLWEYDILEPQIKNLWAFSIQ